PSAYRRPTQRAFRQQNSPSVSPPSRARPRAVLVVTPHFDGKEWSALYEPVRERLRAKRDVGTERPPVRKVDDEADAVAERVSAFRLLLVAQKARGNSQAGEPVKATAQRHEHQL